MKRRRILLAVGAAIAARALPGMAQSKFQPAQDVKPLIEKLTGGKPVERSGVEVELPPLAENGNSVPMHLRVESPMTEQDHVTAIHVIAERNPRPLVATFHFTPQSGRAEISTRVRLAGTQTVTVIAALNNDRYRVATAQVHVTSAACLDESL